MYGILFGCSASSDHRGRHIGSPVSSSSHDTQQHLYCLEADGWGGGGEEHFLFLNTRRHVCAALTNHSPPPPSGLATHQRLLAVDGRAGALGDDLVDALFVNGDVAL